MGRRGAKPIEERIGIERFKELIKRLGIKGVSSLYCEHFMEQSKKANCKACKRSLYRAIERVKKRDRQHKSYAAIAIFQDIPEVHELTKYLRDVKGLTAWKSHINYLERFWNWIKEDEGLRELQRPALWDIRHVQVIIAKLREERISRYMPKQALRRLFEFQGNLKMLKNPLLKAARSELRSPNGVKRKKRRFTTYEAKFIEQLDPDDAFAIKIHITLHCRTIALFGLTWENVNWTDNYYGLPMVTIDCYESKGKTTWQHCPVDLWWGKLSEELKARSQGKKLQDAIMPMTREEYTALFRDKVSKLLGRKTEPYDCRRSPAGWLRDLGLSDLAIGQYKATSGEGIGFTGSGWQNSSIYYNRYGIMNPLGIYDKSQKLDITMFDGLIHKILKNR